MAKNKGLMPKRKKEQRNPRVKNKLKYRKAKIRRQGAVSRLNALVIVFTKKKPVAVAWCPTCTSTCTFKCTCIVGTAQFRCVQMMYEV